MKLRETVHVTVTSADIPNLLNLLQEKAIGTETVNLIDALTISLEIPQKKLAQLETICAKRGDTLQIGGRSGGLLTVKRLIQRPVLILGLLLLVVLTLLLPTRVLFIRIEGNDTLPASLITERAAQIGITFWADRQAVRSEKVKNTLLESMPELQWAGINTQGCVATITVKERPLPDATQQVPDVSSIVAVRDGIIQEITATKGSPACRVGQAVKAGQVLISAYTDCGLTIQACRAEGEVFALTRQELEVVSTTDWLQRGGKTVSEEKYSLIIGKKRINFYKGSGISDTSCVKMYMEKYMTLPGGFVLPVAIVKEILIYEECTSASVAMTEDALSSFARRYLTGSMRSGRVLSREESFATADGCQMLIGSYQCLEMIGIRKQEEIIKPND